jgi:hypothetical protein
MSTLHTNSVDWTRRRRILVDMTINRLKSDR